MSKFKIGDKVKLPTKNTAYGREFNLALCNSYQHAVKAGQDFLYITGEERSGGSISTGFINNKPQTMFHVSDLELYDDFVLPTKWKLKIPMENTEVIKKYILDKYTIKETDAYLNSPELNKCYLYSDDLNHYLPPKFISVDSNRNYTKITFEQFQKYVLKEQVDESKLDELELMMYQSKKLYNL